MKNRIRLTESQLHRVIKESVKRVMKEAKVTPSRVSGFYDQNDLGSDYQLGDDVHTGNAYHPYLKRISREGKWVGDRLQGGKNFGNDFTFSAPDFNGDGMRYFQRADEYEQYIEQNWDKIKEALSNIEDIAD